MQPILNSQLKYCERWCEHWRDGPYCAGSNQEEITQRHHLGEAGLQSEDMNCLQQPNASRANWRCQLPVLPHRSEQELAGSRTGQPHLGIVKAVEMDAEAWEGEK
jgi:hypothetical protein